MFQCMGLYGEIYMRFLFQSQALALTRNCKTPSQPPSTSTATDRLSRESAERITSPPAANSSTPLDNTVSPTSIKEEFDPAKPIIGM